MRDKVLYAIKKYNLLTQGDRVTVGLSGGADSVALLCVLLELKSELKIDISALHVNHMLRGEESDADEIFCRELCERLNVPFKAERVDVPTFCRENKCSDEEGARTLRYRAFEKAADGLIATAHHADDNAETVLLNLARGTAIDGLCGIPVKRQNIIRPLLYCTRDEIERYLSEKKQPYRTDSTNELDFASRNKLRHSVMPVIKEINPSFAGAVERMTISLSEDRTLLDDLANKLFERAVNGDEIDRAVYINEPRPIRIRLLKRLLRENSILVDNDKLTSCDEIMLSGEGSRSLSPQAVFTASECKGKILYKDDGETSEWFMTKVVLPTAEKREIKVEADGKIVKISTLSEKEIKLFVNYRSKQFKNVIDCDKIMESVVLRSRAAGDKIRLHSRKCTKTVKKLLNEAKIPPKKRNSLLAMQSRDELVWLEGFGVSEYAAANKKTVNAVLITVTEKEKQHDQ